MSFLQQFLDKKKICIQCHNNPDSDTLASAYGLYCFFTDREIKTEIIYSGRSPPFIKRAVRHPRHRKQPENSRNSRYFMASAYGLYCFFTDREIKTEIIYSGPKKIEKYNLLYMVEHCEII